MDWLYPILGIAVVERIAPALWRPWSPVPSWFRWQGGSIETLSDEYAFLDYFVPEARRLRKEQGTSRVRSDIWTQVDAEGLESAFRAEAIFGEREVLVIQQVNQEAAEIQSTHQWGRDWALASQRLDRQRQRVEMIGRRKDEFLASMSHELRTPLNSIVGFATLLEQRKGGDLSARQAGFTANILTASRHLLSLINELLDIAKVDAGRLDLHPEFFPAEDCVSEVLTVLMPQAAGKSIHIETGGSGVKIFADRLRLKQILYNLLSNAIKFSPPRGSVRIEFRDTPRGTSVTVSDNGPGIPADQQSTIFDRFQNRSNGKEGTGLGLAITKRLVEAHGGAITLESAPQEGTRFQVTLPHPPDWSATSVRVRPKIAVIEGEPGTGLLIRSILEPEYEVAVHSSWAEARRRFSTDPPGLVFLDSDLADGNCREVLRDIRQEPSLAGTKVAALLRDFKEVDLDPHLTFDDLIRKPLGDGRAIRECVQRECAPQELEHQQPVSE